MTAADTMKLQRTFAPKSLTDSNGCERFGYQDLLFARYVVRMQAIRSSSASETQLPSVHGLRLSHQCGSWFAFAFEWGHLCRND